MKIRLQNMTSIQTGSYLKPEPFGDVIYVQGKDFSGTSQLDKSATPSIQYHAKLERHLLKRDDLLVVAKGNRNTCYVFNDDSRKAIASSTFLVVRIAEKEKSKILPAYLAWFINHPQSQTFLGGLSKGSGISSLSVVSLGELEITIPTLDKQELILKIHGLGKIEQSILLQLAELKQQYNQQLLFNSIK